jgi:ribonuclease HI
MAQNTHVLDPQYWTLYFDLSKQVGGSGAGGVLKSPKGDKLKYVLQIHFNATNNMAKYEALTHGLQIAKYLGFKQIRCFGDLDLVAQQVSGRWDAKYPQMATYKAAVDEFAKCFQGYEVRHIPRADNDEADSLTHLGYGRKPIPAEVFLENLLVPSIQGADPKNPDKYGSPLHTVVAVIPNWTLTKG